MSTDALIDLLLRDEGNVDVPTIDALHSLLDDSTIDSSNAPLGVAEAAALVRLTAHTLRYYEQEGLVCPPRNTAGHREYGPAELRRLVFLTRMRLSGMTMHDLRQYVRLVEEGDSTVPERRQIMIAQRNRIRRQQRELALALVATEYKIRTYGGALPCSPS
ncbi:MerR family transcriptional regulator [Tessaracoccus antarcticus]|uniref:MerR family transcriptional regulator n=1 Tax=Tessaracoccus antarcticus TaxID=2479848 RepID=A0A3M0FYW6_9ACTN|nr:MerR family transcriptional regulator [Tessaracoccus antarcticus]RMB57834.1 MerR family transcriptional regulator [Tessaracoccus antarcticus]